MYLRLSSGKLSAKSRPAMSQPSRAQIGKEGAWNAPWPRPICKLKVKSATAIAQVRSDARFIASAKNALKDRRAKISSDTGGLLSRLAPA